MFVLKNLIYLFNFVKKDLQQRFNFLEKGVISGLGLKKGISFRFLSP